MGEENNYINGYVRDQNNHPISFDTEGNLVDQVTGEKGTMILPGFNIIGISPKTRARNYSSAYHPESSLEFFDIMTRPLTRPFSISQQIGAIRNKINGGTYWDSLLGNEENLGVISKNFNKEMSQYDIVQYLINTDDTLYYTYNLYQGIIKSINNRDKNKFLNIIHNVDKKKLNKYSKTAIKTFLNFENYIVNAFDYELSNGLVEGTNNIIKQLKHNACGYRKFSHLKARVMLVKGIYNPLAA